MQCWKKHIKIIECWVKQLLLDYKMSRKILAFSWWGGAGLLNQIPKTFNGLTWRPQGRQNIACSKKKSCCSFEIPSKVHPILQYTSIYPTLRIFDQGVRYCTHCIRLYGSKKPKWLNWSHNDLKKLCFIIRDCGFSFAKWKMTKLDKSSSKYFGV